MKAYDAGQYSQSAEDFREALKVNPKDDEARFQLAVCYRMLGKYDEAVAELKKVQSPAVLKKVPLLLGDILVTQKKWKDALPVWENFHASTPTLESVRAGGLAEIYENLNQPKKAADNMTVVLEREIKPDNGTLERLARDRIQAGQKDEALHYCETTPYFSKRVSYRDLCKAHVFKAAGDATQAKQHLKKATQDPHNSPAAQLAHAWGQSR